MQLEIIKQKGENVHEVQGCSPEIHSNPTDASLETLMARLKPYIKQPGTMERHSKLEHKTLVQNIDSVIKSRSFVGNDPSKSTKRSLLCGNWFAYIDPQLADSRSGGVSLIGKLLSCVLVYVLWVLIFTTIGERITEDGYYMVMGMTFLLSCFQFLAVSIPKQGTKTAQCITNLKYAMKVFLVNVMVMPVMFSMIFYTLNSYMHDNNQMSLRDLLNAAILSLCCRAISYMALPFNASDDGFIFRCIKYSCKVFIIHSLFILLFVVLGVIDPSSFILRENYWDHRFCDDPLFCVKEYRLFSYFHVQPFENKIPLLYVDWNKVIPAYVLIQTSCIVQSISLIAIYHTNFYFI